MRHDVGRCSGRLGLLEAEVDEGEQDRVLVRRRVPALVQQLEDLLGEGDRAPLVAHCALPVPRLARDDPADAATRVFDVAPVARDDVQVGVADGLPRGLADVDADVVAVGTVAGLDVPAHISHESPHGGLLRRAEREEV